MHERFKKGVSVRLTGEVDVPVGQRQQRRMQRMVTETKDGVPLVDLLHDLRVQTVLLQRTGELDFSTALLIWQSTDVFLFPTLMSWTSCWVGVSMGALVSMTFWMEVAQRVASVSSLQ